MLEVMDTYNHDDFHHQYKKYETYHKISMTINRLPKQVKILPLSQKNFVFLTLLITVLDEMYSMTYIYIV